jgi:glycolate oxidase iron-sulfur subunit
MRRVVVPAYHGRAREFVSRIKDVNEFLAGIGIQTDMAPLNVTVTYQDSCHLAHGQKIKAAPRKLLNAVPGLQFREMRGSDLCCGSAGIYNIVHTEMSMQLLEKKMESVNASKADWIVTANPGCMIQLEAGVRRHGSGQRVLHVVEVLDEAYRGRQAVN